MAFTKISAAAWRTMLRKLWGTPEYPAMAKRLEEAGILNRAAEREKLLAVADKIFKRLGTRVNLKSVSKDTPPLLRFIRESAARSGAAYFPPVKGTGIFDTSYSVARVPGKSVPGAPIFQMHEAFEGLQIAKTPRWRPTSGEHASPAIVLKESQLLPFLPRKDIEHILGMRALTGEREGFSRVGFTYGGTPKVTKTLAKKIEASTKAVVAEREVSMPAESAPRNPLEALLRNIRIGVASSAKKPKLATADLTKSTWLRRCEELRAVWRESTKPGGGS